MYTTQKKWIEKVLDDYKNGTITKDLALQGIQNVLGELKEFKEQKGYAITDYEVNKEIK